VAGTTRRVYLTGPKIKLADLISTARWRRAFSYLLPRPLPTVNSPTTSRMLGKELAPLPRCHNHALVAQWIERGLTTADVTGSTPVEGISFVNPRRRSRAGSGGRWGFYFDQRFCAAFLAISRRFAGVNLSARAFPPLAPPSFPSATAAGLRSSGSVLGVWPVAMSPIILASAIGSRGRFRCLSAMHQVLHRASSDA
jgi:hypothetical protein